MPRERTFRSEAIVLRRIDFGEADRLLTLYSREAGKIRAIAKGARKPQSRKTGHVELFMRSRFLFAKGRDLNIVTQAEMVEAYPTLRQNLLRATYAAHAVELLDRFTVEDDPHSDVYQLLSQALNWFATARDPMLAARYYELRLLTLTGFQPQLYQCIPCNEAIQEQDQFFSAELGGLLCPECQSKERKARPVSSVAVKVMRYLQRRDWPTVSVLNLKPNLQRELENLMLYYLTYTLERKLKSVDFLNRLRQESIRSTELDE